MNDSLPQLPEYDPHPDLWARIDRDLNRLDADTATLNGAVQSLPEYEPKADLWNAIDEQLTEETVKVRPLWSAPVNRSLWSKLAVAAMAVLVGGWFALQMTQSDPVRLEYSVEKTMVATPNDVPDLEDDPTAADQRAEAFIEQQCAEQQLACQRPEVHELRNQLEELTTEQQRLEHERQVFGDDPTLIQAQVRLQNQRATVTKELITLLRT